MTQSRVIARAQQSQHESLARPPIAIAAIGRAVRAVLAPSRSILDGRDDFTFTEVYFICTTAV